MTYTLSLQQRSPAALLRLSTPLLTLLLALLLGSAATPAFALTEADNPRLPVQQAINDIDNELSLLRNALSNNREQLRDDERKLQANEIDTRVLEQARLELASRKSRSNSVKTRILARQEALSSTQEELKTKREELQQLESQDGEASTIATLKAEIAEQAGLSQELDSLLEKLQELQGVLRERIALADQRLGLLQSRFQLPDLSKPRLPASAQRRTAQRKITQLLGEAAAYRRKTAGLDESQPRDLAKMRLLELQAMHAEESADLLQDELKLTRINDALTTLLEFSRAEATPLRVLDNGRDMLRDIKDELGSMRALFNRKQNELQGQQRIIKQQGAIASGEDSTLDQRLGLLNDLLEDIASKSTEVSASDERRISILNDYQRAITASRNRQLFIRAPLPSSREGWRDLGNGLLELPARMWRNLASASESLRNAAVNAGNSKRSLAVLSVIGLLLLAAISRYGLQRYFLNEKSRSWSPTISLIADVLYRNIWFLLPPLMLWLLGQVFALPQTSLALLITLLIIWPIIRIIRDVVEYVVERFTPELDRAATGLALREARWVIGFTGLIIGLLSIAEAVALSPTVSAVIGRVALISLLLIAVPALHLRRLLIAGHPDVSGGGLLGWVSLLLPAILITSAVIGFFGYLNLAWAIVNRLGWILIAFVGLALCTSLLRESMTRYGDSLRERKPDSAEFWINNIFGPVYRLLMLGLVVLTAWLLFWLFDWNSETPLIRQLPGLLNAKLFSVGETAITVRNLVTTIVIVFVVFWAGGWSKQVSYRWAYQRIEDTGIRMSLSTFTQYIVVVFGLMIALKTIGLDLTALTVFAGALGVGIGFGMQQIVVNFISGILLLAERPLRTKDLVNVDKYEGEVTHIGIRSLTVKTFDSQEVIIPNSAVITKPFINWTRSDDVMRTVLMVGISYDDDPHQAMEAIGEIVRAHPATLTEPAPKILLWEYADSALMLRVQLHTRIRGEIGRADVRSQLLLQIWDRFKALDISIPYPQRDVHVRQHNDSDSLNT